MHTSTQRKLIIPDSAMLGQAVIPYQQVSDAPNVPVQRLRPCDVPVQFFKNCLALLFRYSFDKRGEPLVNEQHFAPRKRVAMNYRMANIGHTPQLFLTECGAAAGGLLHSV